MARTQTDRNSTRIGGFDVSGGIPYLGMGETRPLHYDRLDNAVMAAKGHLYIESDPALAQHALSPEEMELSDELSMLSERARIIVRQVTNFRWDERAYARAAADPRARALMDLMDLRAYNARRVQRLIATQETMIIRAAAGQPVDTAHVRTMIDNAAAWLDRLLLPIREEDVNKLAHSAPDTRAG